MLPKAPDSRRVKVRTIVAASAAVFLLGLAIASVPEAALANGRSRVFINGVPVPVNFNDGDSFRAFGGEYAGRQSRLAGYNTLESFGPAHRWGDWHPYELYINAKMATINARRGVWHCFGDGSVDGYGRLLLDCPDLVIDQIRRGFAHAYQVDDTPSRPEYLRAQRQAMREGRGMWAHGIPDYVLTSIHSADEDPGREWHYNRLISTHDGHSESMQHHDTYDRCTWVCNTEIRADEEAVDRVARSLRANPQTAPELSEFANIHVREFVRRFARLGELPEYLTEPGRSAIQPILESARSEGRLGGTRRVEGACMIHVPFRQRYGNRQAHCLRGHGTWHPPGH